MLRGARLTSHELVDSETQLVSRFIEITESCKNEIYVVDQVLLNTHSIHGTGIIYLHIP